MEDINMIINDIDYFVALYTMGSDGFPKYEAHFDDFFGLNDFIEKNSDNPKYTDNQMCYSFVENIDGEATGFSWVSNIEWKIFSDEQIQKEIHDYIDYQKELKEHFEKVDEFSKEIHYYIENDVEYQKKEQRLEDFAYVCPRCIETVENCRCSGYPYYLVQIDKLMVPIIRELNSKGYKTTGCCAGHLYNKNEFMHSGIYIAFAEDYDFDTPFPEGGQYSKLKHAISYIPATENLDDLIKFQRETLYKLEDWAEMLFEIDFLSDFDEDEDEDD